MIHTMKFGLIPPLRVGWYSKRISWSYQLPVNQGRIKFIINNNNIVNNSMPTSLEIIITPAPTTTRGRG
jgi:hypothetical protein